MNTKKHIFSYSISTRPYDRNTDAKNTHLLQWQDKQGTVTDFLSDIKNGYAFCPTFHHDGDTFTNKGKNDKNLKATYFITFDLDAVRLTAGEFYGCMIGTALTPSVVYTTANNGNFKRGKNETYNNRYRVIYILDKPITTASTYTAIHTAIKNEIATMVDDTNILNDTTDKSVSHFFAGCTDTDAFSNNIVISLSWLCDRYSVDLAGKGIRIPSPDNDLNNTPITWASAYDTDNEPTAKESQTDIYSKASAYRESNIQRCETLTEWDNFYNDFTRTDKSISKLYHDYKSVLPRPQEHTPYTIEDPTSLIIPLPDDYIEIRHRGQYVETMNKHGQHVKAWKPYKFKDGQHRRNKVYHYTMLLRWITPAITPIELIWGACVFLHQHIDYNDRMTNTAKQPDRIFKYQVLQIVDGARNTDLNDYKRKVMKNPKFKMPKYKINKAVAVENGFTARQAALMVNNDKRKQAKQKQYEVIAMYYDPDRKPSANLRALNDMGINVSRATLFRFAKEHGFTKQRKTMQEPFADVDSAFAETMAQLPDEETTCKQGANMDYFQNLDIMELAENFLNGGTSEHKTVKPNETCKDFDPWDFYKNHHLDGVRYGKNVVKDREEVELYKRENRAKGIDPDSMTDDEFITWLCTDEDEPTESHGGDSQTDDPEDVAF